MGKIAATACSELRRDTRHGSRAVGRRRRVTGPWGRSRHPAVSGSYITLKPNRLETSAPLDQSNRTWINPPPGD
eukprot:679047-Prymnesium_polylepis.1